MFEILSDRLSGIFRKLSSRGRLSEKDIDEDKYCVDVLNQLSSVIAATQKVAAIILQDHIRGCVRDALTRNEYSDDHVNELVTVVERFTRK